MERFSTQDQPELKQNTAKTGEDIVTALYILLGPGGRCIENRFNFRIQIYLKKCSAYIYIFIFTKLH